MSLELAYLLNNGSPNDMTNCGLFMSFNKLRLYAGTILVIILYFLSINESHGQYKEDPFFDKEIFKHWSINFNSGRTSFFGDVTAYDDELSEKLSKESSMGYGFNIARQISPVVGLGVEFLMGKLVGSTSVSNFETNIIDYNFHITIDAANLFMPGNNANFLPYGKFGLGQFKFDSKLCFDDPEKDDIIVDTGIPEFLYMFGGGINYRLSNSFNINAEISLRMINNDKLDGKSSSSDEDYYSYLSFGITYKINNVTGTIRDYKKMGRRFPLIRRR